VAGLELASRDLQVGRRRLDKGGTRYAVSGEFRIDDTDPTTNIEKLLIFQGPVPELG
jgi:hypothetical protein